MDEDGYTVETVPACEMQVIDVVILVLDSVSCFTRDLTSLVCRHANWKVERKRMAREAATEIERMVSGQ